MTRQRMLRTILLLTLSLCLAPAVPAAGQTDVTTIVLVRHAEAQADAGRDPSLSEVGRARAALLATLLRDAGVRAVYSTQYRRTQETGAPLAAETGADPRPMPIEGDVAPYAAAIVRDVFAGYRGQTVVIVGHSNTVPALVKAFTGHAVDQIDHGTYDHLFIVTARAPGTGTLIRAQYGAAR